MSELLSRGAAFIAGLLLLVLTTLSLMRTVVVPRMLRSTISDAVAATVVAVAKGVARLRSSYRYRDGVLAWVGPTIIIAQLLTWLVLYLLAYGLLLYGQSGQGLGDSIREAGSSLFTLGFAAIDTENQTIIDFAAAATGPIVIALLIGFLPTIYSAYVDREADVTMLSATGGEPAWGPEFLSRFALADAESSLHDVFLRWARWSVQVRLTHSTYPVLVWVRSSRSTRHYIVSLIAIMDAAALRLALKTAGPHREAFALLLEGGQALDVIYAHLYSRRGLRRGLTRRSSTNAVTALTPFEKDLPRWDRRFLALQVASDRDALQGLDHGAVEALAAGDRDVVRLSRADFDRAVDVLRRSGFTIDRPLDEAWQQFQVTRARYEFAAQAICRRLDATPAPWTGDRSVPTPVMWPTSAVDLLPADDGTDT